MDEHVRETAQGRDRLKAFRSPYCAEYLTMLSNNNNNNNKHGNNNNNRTKITTTITSNNTNRNSSGSSNSNDDGDNRLSLYLIQVYPALKVPSCAHLFNLACDTMCI